MFLQDCYQEAHKNFGIDEVYIIDGLEKSVLKKLKQRAALTLDSTDSFIHKNASYDMIFIFHKRVTSTSYIYRFLEFLRSNPNKEEDFKVLYKLVNEEELFEAIKTQKYTLLTTTDLSK